MPKFAVRVNDLWKEYSIGADTHRRQTFREALVSTLSAPFRRLMGEKAEPSGRFWALRGVNFELQSGDVVGIIGRNGAGKSTLLKILSRITEPTRGRAAIIGRVSSLLEVGVGFHPELTGRENILLNGAILGMSRRDIHRRFDEIVAFAETERFIDTPVKRYSSGMYVRLAFAVAAHLESDVLLVDEVLAVGDASFQTKCLGKMNRLAQGGRTVVLVSHNIAAIAELCTRAIVLNEGQEVFDGSVPDAIHKYQEISRGDVHGTEVDLRDWPNRTTNGAARVIGVRCMSLDGRRTIEFAMGEPIVVALTVEFSRPLQRPLVALGILNELHQTVFSTVSSDSMQLEDVQPGILEYSVTLQPCHLLPGRYRLSTYVARDFVETHDLVPDTPGFTVVPVKGMPDFVHDRRSGHLFLRFPWKVRSAPTSERPL